MTDRRERTFDDVCRFQILPGLGREVVVFDAYEGVECRELSWSQLSRFPGASAWPSRASSSAVCSRHWRSRVLIIAGRGSSANLFARLPEVERTVGKRELRRHRKPAVSNPGATAARIGRFRVPVDEANEFFFALRRGTDDDPVSHCDVDHRIDPRSIVGKARAAMHPTEATDPGFSLRYRTTMIWNPVPAPRIEVVEG